jgi:hypothetical protein
MQAKNRANNQEKPFLWPSLFGRGKVGWREQH